MRLLLLGIMIVSSGCMTTDSFIQKLNNAPDATSPEQVRSVIGEPISEHLREDGLMFMRYSAGDGTPLIVLFYNSEKIYYGQDDKLNIVNALYSRNLISGTRYHRELATIRAELEHREKMLLMQSEQDYKNEMLSLQRRAVENQEEALQTQKSFTRRSAHPALFQSKRKTHCESDGFGGVDCETSY